MLAPAQGHVLYRWRGREAAEVKPRVRVAVRVGAIIAILGCIAGVLAISRIFLINNSIRLDEAQSLWQSSHSIRGTLKVVAQDVHVPLYHLVLHFWQFYLGQSIQTARLLSLGFFIATIPFVYLLARRVLTVNWSLLVVALFSFSPFMNWYANEARMYTMLVFVATLSQYFFVKLVDSEGKKGWLGYSLVALIGIYTHYFFIFNLVAQGIFFVINRRNFAPGTFKKFAILAAGLAVALAPWIYYFRSLGSAANTSPNLARPSTVDFFNVFSQFSFGFQTDVINTVLVSTWPIVVVIALLAVRSGQRVTLNISYLATAAFLPILLAFGLSFIVSPFFLSRYMVSCVPPLLILVVWFISHYRRKLALAVTAVVACVLVITSLEQYTSSATPVKEDYKGAASLINAEVKPQDIVVLSAPFTVYPFDYYYTGQAQLNTLPIWNRQVPGAIPGFDKVALPAQVDQLKKDHTNIYLLLSVDQGYEKDIHQYFEQHFERVKRQTFSNDLTLYIYKVGYDHVKPLEALPNEP